MIVRIVKMHFRPDAVQEFLDIFERSCEQIRAFPGCEHLELWQDRHDRGIFFTHSRWQSLEQLNAYRDSALFASVWPRTKALFAAMPEAWSTELIKEL
jgi:quinol monooxygenase YgiN